MCSRIGRVGRRSREDGYSLGKSRQGDVYLAGFQRVVAQIVEIARVEHLVASLPCKYEAFLEGPDSIGLTRTWSAVRPDLGACSPHSASISRSEDTTSFALNNSTASSARSAPASGTISSPSATSIGPRIPNCICLATA